MNPCITQQCSFHDINSTNGCNWGVGESCPNYTTMKGGDVKRYKIMLGAAEGYPAISKAKMIEDPNGEYVKWDDVKSLWETILNMNSSQLANWMDSMSYKGRIKKERRGA